LLIDKKDKTGMTLETWLLFLPGAFALNVFPGPNNLLSISNGARYGFSKAFQAGFGRLPVFAVMVVMTAAGLGALLAASDTAFTILKWVGAAYLFYLGLKMVIARAVMNFSESDHAEPASVQTLRRREFLVASSNPKAIAIFTAFMPQFIQPGEAIWLQLLLMGSAFIVMEIGAIAIYAIMGARLRSLAQSESGLTWINRGSGGALIVSGIALLSSQRAATN